MLKQALEQALQQEGTDGVLSEVSDFLAENGVRSLIVAVDDQNVAPYVATKIQKSDLTIAMVEGFVFVLLDEAGIKNAAPQAKIAASFVVNYIKRNAAGR